MKPWSKPRQSRVDAETFLLRAQHLVASLGDHEPHRGVPLPIVDLQHVTPLTGEHECNPYLCSVRDCPARRWLPAETELSGAD